MKRFSFTNMSSIYILVVLFVVFSIWIPDKFLQSGVWRSLLDANSLTALAALAALIPLICGSLNLAVGAQVGFAAIVSAIFLGKTGMPSQLQFPLVLLIGAAIGFLMGLLVTKVRIDSIIATLAMSSVLAAGNRWVSGANQVIFSDKHPHYVDLAIHRVLGITIPVYILVVVALVLWYVSERTPVGRRMYSAGFNPESAKLAGVNVDRLQIGGLVVSGFLSALAGLLLTSRVSAGDPTIGPSYLLPALTAVFLGSTQFRGGRFNVWGTVVSLYVLAVGIKGLQLVGAARWVEDLFYGLSLLVAVALAHWGQRIKLLSAIRRATTLRRRQTV